MSLKLIQALLEQGQAAKAFELARDYKSRLVEQGAPDSLLIAIDEILASTSHAHQSQAAFDDMSLIADTFRVRDSAPTMSQLTGFLNADHAYRSWIMRLCSPNALAKTNTFKLSTREEIYRLALPTSDLFDWHDGWLEDRLTLVVLASKHVGAKLQSKELLVMQYECISGSWIEIPTTSKAGTSCIRIRLISHFTPVIAVQCIDLKPTRISLIPSPALLRNGIYYPELLYFAARATSVAEAIVDWLDCLQSFRLHQARIRTIFLDDGCFYKAFESKDYIDWLSSTFDIQIVHRTATDFKPVPNAEDILCLRLSGNSYPSMAVLWGTEIGRTTRQYYSPLYLTAATAIGDNIDVFSASMILPPCSTDDDDIESLDNSHIISDTSEISSLFTISTKYSAIRRYITDTRDPIAIYFQEPSFGERLDTLVRPRDQLTRSTSEKVTCIISGHLIGDPELITSAINDVTRNLTCLDCEIVICSSNEVRKVLINRHSDNQKSHAGVKIRYVDCNQTISSLLQSLDSSWVILLDPTVRSVQSSLYDYLLENLARNDISAASPLVVNDSLVPRVWSEPNLEAGLFLDNVDTYYRYIQLSRRKVPSSLPLGISIRILSNTPDCIAFRRSSSLMGALLLNEHHLDDLELQIASALLEESLLGRLVILDTSLCVIRTKPDLPERRLFVPNLDHHRIACDLLNTVAACTRVSRLT